MDEADIANEALAGAQARLLAEKERIRNLPKLKSRKYCRNCEAEIPEARREIIKGCQLCVECQMWVESN